MEGGKSSSYTPMTHRCQDPSAALGVVTLFRSQPPLQKLMPRILCTQHTVTLHESRLNTKTSHPICNVQHICLSTLSHQPSIRDRTHG